MAIRMAEYAFIVARQFAEWDIGRATVPMPRFAVVYVKKTNRTPKTTTVTFTFPDGQKVDYKSDNVILEELTREYIIEKRLFPYIPFYIARYEKDITSEEPVDKAVEDLKYFRDELLRLYRANELTNLEMTDLIGFIKTIITHITNGNKNEERLVDVMGGTIIETESERLIKQGMRQGEAKMIVVIGRKEGLDDTKILERLQDMMGLSMEDAGAYLAEYRKYKKML